MPKHYVLRFHPAFGYAKAQAVKADRVEERGPQLAFVRGERTVYQAPAQYIVEMIEMDNQILAEDRVAEIIREQGDSPSFRLQEYGVARRSAPDHEPQGGFIAEAVSMRVIEK